MYFEDIQLGTAFTTDAVVIEKEKMLAFAQLYDWIPLHTDEAYAQKTRFGGLIAPGVISFMSVWAKYLEKDLFGPELIAGQSTKIEWLKPVYANDTLIGTVEVTALTSRNPRNGLVEITIHIHNQKNELVMKDVTEAVVKRRTPSES